tara:strand:+ start:226 stop:1500 length:1275 start_codon:yes stop_codon:yes gene_type:complete
MNNLENKKILLDISYIFFCLIPVGLVTGPFLPDLFLSLISLIYILFFYKIDQINKYIKIFIYFSLSFYFIIVLSSLFSETILISLKSSIFYFRFIFFIPAILFIYKSKTNLINHFFYITILTCLIIIFDSYLQYLYGKNILGFSPIKISDYDLRITGMFGKDEVLGSFLSKVLPIIISLIFLKNSKNKDILSIIFLIIFGIAIFLSSERASFIHFLMFSILFFFLAELSFKIKLSFFLLIPILLLIIANDSGKKHRMVDNTINSIKNLQFSTYHTDHYKTALNMYNDKKIIGHGPKSFRFKCSDPKYKVSKNSCSTHPHNTYLQLLSETGILGFLIIFISFSCLAYLILKIFIYKYFTKKTLFHNSQLSIIIGLFVFLWPISPNGNFFNNWLSIILFLQITVLFFTFFYSSDSKIKTNIKKYIS